MGLMRFRLTPPKPLAEEALLLAYLSGIDRTPWPVRARLEGHELLLDRDVSESGNLSILWEVEGHGAVAVSTASLIERPEPYELPLELARGTISQLRNQLADWQMIGLAVPEPVNEKVRESVTKFAWAAVNQEQPAESAAAAQEALQIALDGSQLLANAYAEQAIAVRRRAGGKLASLFGCELSGADLPGPIAALVPATFNTAIVPMSWRQIEADEGEFSWTACDSQIEACRNLGLKVCVGPLLRLDQRGLPDWSYLWEDDLDSLLAAASEFIRAAIGRYRGKVDYWLCAARVNTAEILSLTEEERLRLAAGAVHVVRSLDPSTPTIVSLDQPWGEYMARRPVDFAPLHFADALVRAGLDLKAVMLEVNLGCTRNATLPRTALEFSRQLDYWNLLGLPLLISLSIPSAGQEDPRAMYGAPACAGNWTPQNQAAWVARLVPLLLAKPGLSGVFWGELRDGQPRDFPYTGLVDDRGQPKPAFKTLTAIRQACVR